MLGLQMWGHFYLAFLREFLGTKLRLFASCKDPLAQGLSGLHRKQFHPLSHLIGP